MAATDAAAGTKWLRHYSSDQSILVVGDGDFSFSLALATAFGSGKNLVATSLDSYDELIISYSDAASNVKELERLGATVLHGIDATEMHLDTPPELDNVGTIKSHQELVRGFFAPARHLLLSYHGAIHVTHKTKHPYSEWGIEQLASESSLTMFEEASFEIEDYPGYI